MMSQITDDLARAFTQAESHIFIGDNDYKITSLVDDFQEQIDALKARIEELEKNNTVFKESL